MDIRGKTARDNLFCLVVLPPFSPQARRDLHYKALTTPAHMSKGALSAQPGHKAGVDAQRGFTANADAHQG